MYVCMCRSLAQSSFSKTNRTVGIYVELKHPDYFNAQGPLLHAYTNTYMHTYIHSHMLRYIYIRYTLFYLTAIKVLIDR